ncbi:MAG: hypothetical protein WKF90_12275 [Pyrinomonadaceae bacterium]
MDDDQDVTIQDLYPELTPEQQEEAERNLLGYLDVVRRIYERLESEGRLDELAETLSREKRLNNEQSN